MFGKSNDEKIRADKRTYVIGALDAIWWTLNRFGYASSSGRIVIGLAGVNVEIAFREMAEILSKRAGIEIDADLINAVVNKSILLRY